MLLRKNDIGLLLQRCRHCICAVNGSRVTLRDVAAAAALSVSAVSQALRNHPSIPEETRNRVRTIAGEIGYRPDPVLAALNLYRHDRRGTERKVVIAYVTCFPARETWRQTTFYSRTFLGAEQRAAELGYRLEHFWLHDAGVSVDRFCDMLLARGIRGLLIAPLPTPGGELALRWEEFSSVAIGPSLVRPVLHSACNNHYQSMLLALTRLRERGYRRIGLVLDPEVDRRHQQKYQAAFYMEQRSFPTTEARIPPLLTGELTDAVVGRWLTKSRPDVVLGHTDRLWPIIDRLNQRRSTRVAFVSLICNARGRIAGIDTDPERIAAAAVERLNLLLAANETGIPSAPSCLMLDGVWVEGGTIRPR